MPFNYIYHLSEPWNSEQQLCKNELMVLITELVVLTTERLTWLQTIAREMVITRGS